MIYGLQNLLIIIFNSIYKFTIKINENIKNLIIILCFSISFIMPMLNLSNFEWWHFFNYTKQAMVGCILLMIIIICSIKGKLQLLNYNKVFTFFWCACAILILIASFHHVVGSGMRALTILMLIAFPCLYFIWGNRGDYNVLYELTAKAFVLVGIICYLYSFIFIPLDEGNSFGRYIGPTNNPNAMGMICAVVFMCALYLIANNNKWFIVYIFISGVSVTYVVASGSRTAMLAMSFAFLAFMIFIIKKQIIGNEKERVQKSGVRLIVVLLIIAGFALIIPVYNKHIESNLQEKIRETSKEITTDVQEQTEQEEPVLIERSVNNSDLNSLSSGRIERWIYYGEQLNLMGNNIDNGRKGDVGWVHFSALEIGYRTGIINGIIFLIIEIITAIYMIAFIFKKKYKESKYLFSAMAISVFGIYSLLDVAIFPFMTPPVLLYYISLISIFHNKTDNPDVSLT